MKRSNKGFTAKLAMSITTAQLFRAGDLAELHGVSIRTVYRHINRLRQRGYDIRGETGIGYLTRRLPEGENA